jgi:hypothetical protein
MQDSNLSTELGTDGLNVTGSSWCRSHLHSHDSTEWASVGRVDNLDEADSGLAPDVTSAGSASWDGSSKWVVLVDV